MSFIAGITILLLTIMGLFHFYWAFGGTFGIDKVIPTKNDQKLFRPGKIVTILVGLVLFFFAYVAYTLAYTQEHSPLINYIAWGLCTIFFLRALGDFNTLGFFKKIKSSEFARYDTLFFSPVCLFFSIVFAILAM